MQREQKSGQDMERLLLALQGRLGEEFHVKSDRDGEKTVFAVKKKGEEAGILLYPESHRVRRCLRNKGVWETAALLERMYKRKRSHLSKKELMGAKFSEVKGQILFTLESREECKEALHHIPHQPVLEMEMIGRLVVKQKGETYYRTINKDNLKAWGIEENELFALAKSNAPQLFPAYTMTLTDETGVWDIGKQKNFKRFFSAIETFNQVRESSFPILALLNHFCSVNSVLYEGYMEFLANIWNDHVVILMGTRDDCFLYPFESYEKCPDLTVKLAREIKRANLWGLPYLSEHLYLYDRAEKTFRILPERINWDEFPEK